MQINIDFGTVGTGNELYVKVFIDNGRLDDINKGETIANARYEKIGTNPICIVTCKKVIIVILLPYLPKEAKVYDEKIDKIVMDLIKPYLIQQIEENLIGKVSISYPTTLFYDSIYYGYWPSYQSMILSREWLKYKLLKDFKKSDLIRKKIHGYHNIVEIDSLLNQMVKVEKVKSEFQTNPKLNIKTFYKSL